MALREVTTSTPDVLNPYLDPDTFLSVHGRCGKKVYRATLMKPGGLEVESVHLVCGQHSVTSLPYTNPPLDNT